jgi:hypothetical protein
MESSAGITPMPLTEFQKRILKLLAENRSLESHVGGGLVLNSEDDSPRYSKDVDIFHEAAVEVVKSSEADVSVLEGEGYEVSKVRGDWEQTTTFRKAKVRRDGKEVKIDWVADTAVRFYPVVQDEVMGWRLHWFDVAVNKVLALAARSVSRDYIDTVELGKRIPLAALCWAACGKDEGYSPVFLIQMMKRFARVTPEEVAEVKARDIDLIELKKAWIEMSDAAELEMIALADEESDVPIGVAFVDAEGNPGWYRDDPSLLIHPVSVRGCWPRIEGKD